MHLAGKNCLASVIFEEEFSNFKKQVGDTRFVRNARVVGPFGAGGCRTLGSLCLFSWATEGSVALRSIL